MQFLIGLLSGVGFFVCLMLAYIAGKRSMARPVTQNKEVPDEEMRKAKKLRTDFLRLMNYDVSKALDGKKVE